MTPVSDHNDLSHLNLQNDAFAHIRKQSLDLFNRLHSIEEDVEFVNQVHAAYPNIPLIPNLRCGAWYCDPVIQAAPHPAYFKSTDGHTSNWQFNLRRPNLHLLPVILRSEGIVLVDSTRAGKRVPDALSKTVPIWCAVVNRAMVLRYPELGEGSGAWDTNLHTPPLSVSKQEHAQIEKLLDDWAGALNNSSYAIPRFSKPLRPIWITPASSSFPPFNDVQFLPVICVSASRQVEDSLDRRSGGFVYVQGSGDDHELWGKGLNPQKFWAHRTRLLSAPRAEVEETVASVNEMYGTTTRHTTPPTGISKVGNSIRISSLEDVSAEVQRPEDLTAYVLISNDSAGWPGIQEGIDVDEQAMKLRIVLPEGKKGQMHFLQVVLPRSLQFIRTQLSNGCSVCISCPTGNDISVGVTVAALQNFFNNNGELALNRPEIANKSTIRTRLEWIISDRPTANPSRNTLKRVNEYLLSPTEFRMSSVKTR
ncbi:tRNA A64-2'-O-ribosylphosphate transferase [Marasmius crinis-equi]|uniref:tRNA A64-2'-O-ribosylphosphate transferase n=1 Tax=Marasmius crinis-equi TaxID=585013 RepID=A0ABR3FQI1_9AGAR